MIEWSEKETYQKIYIKTTITKDQRRHTQCIWRWKRAFKWNLMKNKE